MKKLIALVLTVAMMVGVCAISASAATAPELLAEGAATVTVGEKYSVAVRLNDADNQVGGFQAELAYTGATVSSVVVNPDVLAYNKTNDAGTIAVDDGNSVNIAAVANLSGTNYKTRIWVKVTFTVTEENPTFKLENVVFSDKNASVLEGSVGTQLAPTTATTDVKLNKVGMLPSKTADKQGVVVNGSVTADDIKEFGVLFYPTQLLDGALTLETEGALKASITSDSASFDTLKTDFDASLKMNFSTDAKSAKFLGIKVTSVVYCVKTNGDVIYSQNNVDKYIQGGVADKAILNTALDIVNAIEDKDDTLTAALADLDTDSTMVANRNTVLSYAVDAAQ